MAVRVIPVIDLFSGPGGLSEGFSRYGEFDWESELSAQVVARPANPLGGRREKTLFRVALSIEKDEWAHRTLELRAFFREFRGGTVPEEYFQYLRGGIDRDALFGKYKAKATAAASEAWQAELGKVAEEDVDRRILGAIGAEPEWVLIGGPPCQAYSLAGRSRRRSISTYDPKTDDRHFLYKEYLRIVARFEPPVFVMENVKGMLSSKMDGKPIVERILADLREPGKATGQKGSPNLRYRLFALGHAVENGLWEASKLTDYVLRMERHGIPQARHRVILLGVKEEAGPIIIPEVLPARHPVSARDVLRYLPRLRSGLSKEEDSPEAWMEALAKARKLGWYKHESITRNDKLRKLLARTLKLQGSSTRGRGGPFVRWENPRVEYAPSWFIDRRLGGVCNHQTRGHIEADLHRYLFAACHGEVLKRSPRLEDFPPDLLPKHKNAKLAIKEGGNFDDRFRVQIAKRPSTTITSHISKDGHYYIHYDPIQCRALTVREAARLQTFPDNYLFCGNRTQQYHQVGNAVPPLIAVQIARIVAQLF